MIPRQICKTFYLILINSVDSFRLAANDKQYISTIMQIRDLRDKRRLIIKATDIVLFGPPQGKTIDFEIILSNDLFLCRRL